MMDYRAFKKLLEDLSQFSGLRFEIHGAHGETIYKTGDRGDAGLSNAFVELSRKIVSEEAPASAFFNAECRLCGVPICQEDRVIGSLAACPATNENSECASDQTFQRSPGGGQLMAFLASVTKLMEEKWALENEVADLSEELSQSFEDLHLYSTIANQIKTLRFSENLLKDLIEQLLLSMRLDIAFASFSERPTYNTLLQRKDVSQGFEDTRRFASSLINAIPDIAATRTENYFIINDSRSSTAYRQLVQDPYRFLAVEVRHNEAFYGWLGLVSFDLETSFRRGELSLAKSLAQQLAASIANSDLYRDLERFVINVVKSLVHAIEAKDVYTRGHSERVSQLSMLMAEHLGLAKKDCDALRWASILHDVGKIAIPEAVLNKKDRLTHDEYELIKTHPEKGYEILEPIEQLSDSLLGILYHHERVDGRGYPRGLVGPEIHPFARIIAIADTFDAITSDRAYRKGQSPAQAMAVIEAVSGTQLDPQLVEVFGAVFEHDLKHGEHGWERRPHGDGVTRLNAVCSG